MHERAIDAVHVVPYHPDLHLAAAYAIWERCFGERWPITPDTFREIAEAAFSRVETHQLVATDDSGRILGYIESQLRPRKETEAGIGYPGTPPVPARRVPGLAPLVRPRG